MNIKIKANPIVDTVAILESHGMIKDGMSVLDIGCFTGNWADTLKLKGYSVNYLGMDVSRGAINRAKSKHIDDGYNFQHIDVFNPIYYPIGRGNASEYIFPISNFSIDLIICHSLFTHLGEYSNAENYMDEIKRVLKPSGFLWITFFQSPPNEPSDSAIRTVYALHQINELLEGFKEITRFGGETNDFNNQLQIALYR